jgi:mercuric ion transport protein
MHLLSTASKEAVRMSEAVDSTDFTHDAAGAGGRQTLAATGSLLGALAASSCCIAPVVLFSLGVSGAWIGNLTMLAPYQPYFIAATAAFLGYGYWLVYRSPKISCSVGAACARPVSNRLTLGALVVATLLVVVALGFNLLAPYLFV